MGLEPNFVMPESGESEDGTQLPAYDYVEFFGIKNIDGDVLSYTTLAVEEPELVNKEPETIYISVPKDELDELKEVICETPSSEDIKDVTSGDICVKVDADKYLEITGNPEPTAEDREEMTEREHEIAQQFGWQLEPNDDGTFTVVDSDGREVTSADLADAGVEIPDFTADDDVIYEETVTAEDEAEFNRMSAESIIWWLFATDVQAGEIAAEKQAVANSLNAANSTGGDLKQVMNMYQKTYDASVYNQVFKIFVDVYACHTYNAAASQDNKQADTDWFFVKQYAQLNPVGNYSIEKSHGTTAAVIRGYMVYYSFDNWTVKADGTEYTDGVTLMKPKPDSTVGSTGTAEGTSFSFGGNLGFSGLAGAGGLNFGGTFSYEQSTTVPDCQVDNQSDASGKVEHATWKYSFSRPQTTGHPCIGCNNFRDAPTSARSMFQPENQWTWQLNNTARENVKGFKFKWQNGYSIGEGFAWWIKVANVEHIDWVTRETTFYVSFAAIMPPLIAASYDTDYRGDFTASAGAKKIIVGVYGRSWDAKVVEGGSWCTLDQSSKQTSTNGGENSIFVEAAANNTGASRTAIVRFTTTDGTNKSFDFRVYQARY